MREICQSGSEGGGVGTTGAPYPYCVPAIRALAEMFPICDQNRSADQAAAIPSSQFSCV